MTIPKAISDAIDAYNDALLSGAGSPVDFDCNDARAALERAIAEHVADHVADAGKMVPVAAPTEAEIEDWSRRMNNANNGDKPGWIDELRREAVALMLRAAAAKPSDAYAELHEMTGQLCGCLGVEFDMERRIDRAKLDRLAWHLDRTEKLLEKLPEPGTAAATPAPPWNGGPTVTAMMRGVEDAAIEWVKCVVDYNASCQAAPPPSGLEASEAVRKAGHKCELAYGYFQKAITALADHRATPAPSALERVRERVRAVAECRSGMGQYIWDEQTRAAMHRVLGWIDEEREREVKHGWHR